MNIAAAGIAVFPVTLVGPDRRKVPTVKGGFHAASNDPAQIFAMWQQRPGPLIGIPTGAINGFDVLDLDIKKHHEAGEWLERNINRLPPTLTVETRHGLHGFFEHAPGLRCSTSAICTGVDTRADGGFVVAWFAAGLRVVGDAPIAPWPSWLLAELREKAAPKTPSAIQYQNRNAGTLTHAQLAGLARAVAMANEGSRNAMLYWATHRVIDGGGGNFAFDVLRAAARRAGLPEHETTQTIKSAAKRAS
ncbi:MAG TPA: bifunctional DNA primase/polymerase [Stellaceae bacterium]|jgi:hypothetical protein|nr:bifunctional DNA primase/polymerase [Stellaceae bacterium]